MPTNTNHPDVVRFVAASKAMRDTVTPIVLGQVTDQDDIEAFIGRAVNDMFRMAEAVNAMAGNPEHDAKTGLVYTEQMCQTLSTACETISKLAQTASIKRVLSELADHTGG